MSSLFYAAELRALAQHDPTFVDLEPLEDDMVSELLRGFAGDRLEAEPCREAQLRPYYESPDLGPDLHRPLRSLRCGRDQTRC